MTAKICGKCGTKIFADAPQGFCSICMLRTGLGPLTEEIDDALDGSAARMLMDFGEYELQGEIGRGGQGVVYRARQKNLNRTVAIKVIALGPWATEAHLKRFRLEAEAAASLDHPRIVPIYEIGQRDGCCYFSMKFVEGGQLDEAIRHKSMPPRLAMELVAKLARTVHYAHQRGILHLDIKPGNILVDGDGEPHLTDFGLARLVEKESTIARTIEVLGTPSYMAPEQAAGQTGQFTTATDIYGLGAVAYQLLTGQPPFVGGTTYETIRQVLETEPRPPSLLNRALGRDLETICLKCLEKDPAKRFASADALANDLERFLRGEPIRSRRISGTERVWRWCKRKPVIAGLTSALIATALLGGLAVLWQLRRLEKEHAVVRRNLYTADMNLARQAWEEGNAQHAQSLLRAHLPGRGETDLRGFEWRYLWRLCQDESRFTFSDIGFHPTTAASGGVDLREMVPSGDGRTIVCASGTSLKWLDLQSRGEAKSLNVASKSVTLVASAAKRPGLIAYWADKIVRCVAPDGEMLLGGGLPDEHCGCLALSPDGTLLVTGGLHAGESIPVRLWDVKSGTKLAEYAPGEGVVSLAFSPDGQFVVCGRANDSAIEALEVPTLRVLRRLEGHMAWPIALAFDLQGKHLASGGRDGLIILWNFPDGDEVTRLSAQSGRVGDLAFSPDGRTLASTGGDHTVRLWNLARPTTHTILHGHRGRVRSVFFAENGRELYTASDDGTVKIWEVPASKANILRCDGTLINFAFSPDGKLLAGADYRQHVMQVWDLATRERWEPDFARDERPVSSVAFSSDGEFLATGGFDNEVKVWNVSDRKIAFRFPKGNIQGRYGMEFHPSKPILGLAGDTIHFWDARSGGELTLLNNPPPHGILRISFSRDGRWLGLALNNGAVEIWNLATGHRLHSFHENPSAAGRLCFSNDSSLLASVSDNRRITIYDVRRKQPLTSFEPHTDPVWGLAFAPDDRTLVSTSWDGTIKFSSVANRQQVLTLTHDGGPVYFVAFSPDGNVMATSGADGTVRFWPAPSLAEIDASIQAKSSDR